MEYDKKTMSIIDKTSKYSTIILIIGFSLLSFTIFSFLSHYFFMVNSEKVQGTIYYIDSYDNHRKNLSEGDARRLSHHLYISFYYDGNYYEVMQNTDRDDMYVGQVLELYINSNNPSKVRMSNTNISFLFIILFSPFFCFGFFYIFRCNKRKKRKNKLRSMNFICIAQIVGWEIVWVGAYGHMYYVFNCVSYYNGYTLTFNSPHITIDNQNANNYIGCNVPVYVNPQDWNDYYVDLEAI